MRNSTWDWTSTLKSTRPSILRLGESLIRVLDPEDVMQFDTFPGASGGIPSKVLLLSRAHCDRFVSQ